MLNKMFVVFTIGWFLTIVKHFYILPIYSFEDGDITGIEFRLRF